MRKRAKTKHLCLHIDPRNSGSQELCPMIFLFLKMRKLARQKPILDFNHIDPRISKEELGEIQKLYKHYKKIMVVLQKSSPKTKTP